MSIGFAFWLLHNLELSRLVRNSLSALTDSRHLNEIFLDTLYVFRFCVHDSLNRYAASLTTRSSILESVFKCLFRRALSQVSHTHPT
jgi:hypothetical protein